MDGKRNAYDLNDVFALIGNVRGPTNPGLYANMSLATKQGLDSVVQHQSFQVVLRNGLVESKGLLVAPRVLD